jgi:glycosyltransferase involved in cell wall biosynthesis
LVATPVLTTIHGFSSPHIVPVYEKYDGSTYYVAISDADRHEKLTYVATIHHGIEIEDFVHYPEGGDYLLFFGRIHPDKGAAEAIEVASRVGKPLVIAGIIQDQGYFDRKVAPRLDEKHVRYIGSVGPDRRCEVLGRACGLLHLINFDEPFGLSVVESMACGTPVIACARGSMPELIQPGVNGFLVDSIEEATAAVQALGSLDRHRTRASVATRFSRERMVDDYVRAYRKVVALAQENRST